MGKTYLFVSGKGGVGKTTICTNLAVTLALKDARVLVIDADLWLRNADILLGLQNYALIDVQDMYLGNSDFHKAVIHHPIIEGLDFIAAPSSLRSSASVLFDYIESIAEENAEMYDYIFVDCPAGITVCESKLANRRNRAVVVSTFDLTSIRDAEKTVSLLKKHGLKDCRLIINKVNSSMVKKELAPNLDEIIDGISVRLIGMVPEERIISAYTYAEKFACTNGTVKLRRAFANIAGRFQGLNVPLIKI